jgi:hypothetical protein
MQLSEKITNNLASKNITVLTVHLCMQRERQIKTAVKFPEQI